MPTKNSPGEIAYAKAERQRRWREAKREREIAEREAQHALGLDDYDDPPIMTMTDDGPRELAGDELAAFVAKRIAKRWGFSPAVSLVAAWTARWSFDSQEDADAFARRIESAE
jgi:hypothetical protein